MVAVVAAGAVVVDVVVSFTSVSHITDAFGCIQLE